jgi:hypothetical protein
MKKWGNMEKKIKKNIVKPGYANYPLWTGFFWKYLTLIIKSKW